MLLATDHLHAEQRERETERGRQPEERDRDQAQDADDEPEPGLGRLVDELADADLLRAQARVGRLFLEGTELEQELAHPQAPRRGSGDRLSCAVDVHEVTVAGAPCRDDARVGCRARAHVPPATIATMRCKLE
jgi:hypothetical protein